MVSSIVIAVTALLLSASPVLAQQNFQHGRASVYTPGASRDSTGVTARGTFGLDLQDSTRPVELFRSETSVGQTCGGFDFFASIQANLEAIPGLLEDILTQFVIAGLPRLILCYASPTVCDLYKHFEAFMNAIVTAQMAQCNAVQTASAAAGLKLRGGQAAKCLEDEQAAGTPLNLALDNCLMQTSSLRGPRGQRVQSYELFESILGNHGVSPDTIALVNGMLGTFTFTANGQLLTDYAQDNRAVYREYDRLRVEVEEAVDEAIDDADDGVISEDSLRDISIPGQAVPAAVINKINQMRPDPVRFQAFRDKLISGIAITEFTYNLREARSILDNATIGNAQIDLEERHILEQISVNLGRAIDDVIQNKETGERHLSPTFDAILSEAAALNSESGQLAARVGSDAPIETALPDGQTTIGYSY